MRITIESTDTMTSIDEVPVRHWIGTTEGGNRVHVFVHRIAAGDEPAQAELAKVLVEKGEPEEIARRRRGVQLSMIL